MKPLDPERLLLLSAALKYLSQIENVSGPLILIIDKAPPEPVAGATIVVSKLYFIITLHIYVLIRPGLIVNDRQGPENRVSAPPGYFLSLLPSAGHKVKYYRHLQVY